MTTERTKLCIIVSLAKWESPPYFFENITPKKIPKGIKIKIVDDFYEAFVIPKDISIDEIKQDIIDNIEFLLASTPDGYRQAEQAFDVATFEINKMKYK